MAMSSIELAAVVFAACNAMRVLAYFPQIIRVARDHDGAKGLSCFTWAGFAVSNLSTVVYALVVISDWNMAAVFGVNAGFCLAIVLLTFCKRVDVQWHRRTSNGIASGRQTKPDFAGLSIQSFTNSKA
jgi:hypothetical protein